MKSTIDYIRILPLSGETGLENEQLLSGTLVDEDVTRAYTYALNDFKENTPWLDYEYQIKSKTGIQRTNLKEISDRTKQFFAQVQYKRQIKKVAEKFEALYNYTANNIAYSIFQSRAGKGIKLNIDENKIIDNIPCIYAEGEGLENISLWAIYRGLPHRMRSFSMTPTKYLFLLPEYIFETDTRTFIQEVRDSFDYIKIIGNASHISFYKGKTDEYITPISEVYSNLPANLNLIED